MLTLSSLGDKQVVELLQNGKVGVLPTDTIYGLAALASNQAAVARLYALKQRERKPGTVIAANIRQLIDLGLDESTLKAVQHLWPNPLSVIIPAEARLAYLDQGLGDVAVRIPRDTAVRALLEEIGPLLTSSANHPGKPPAANLAEAERYFAADVDFYVDGGDLSNRPASTVVRYQDGRFQILRHGAVGIDEKGNILSA